MKYVRSSQEELKNRKVHVCVVFKVCVDTTRYRTKIESTDKETVKKNANCNGTVQNVCHFSGYPFFKEKINKKIKR